MIQFDIHNTGHLGSYISMFNIQVIVKLLILFFSYFSQPKTKRNGKRDPHMVNQMYVIDVTNISMWYGLRMFVHWTLCSPYNICIYTWYVWQLKDMSLWCLCSYFIPKTKTLSIMKIIMLLITFVWTRAIDYQGRETNTHISGVTHAHARGSHQPGRMEECSKS